MYHTGGLCITESDGTLLKNVVLPFVVGVMKKEVVTVRVGTRNCENMVEGTQGDLYRKLVSALTLPNDWILDMDLSDGKFQSTLIDVKV